MENQIELIIRCSLYEFLLVCFLVMTGVLDLEKGFRLPRVIRRKYRELSLDIRLFTFKLSNKIKATFFNLFES